MEIKNMKHSDIEVRMSQIDDELQQEDITEETVEKLENEINELKERDEELKEEAKQEEEKRMKVLKEGTIIESRKVETNKMEETRKMEMLDAIAETIKGRATDEQRSLLTTNVEGGTVAISEIMDGWVWTDWEKSPILSRVRKSYVRGNYKVQYEISATGAVKHVEGSGPIQEEQLVLGVIDFTSEYFKKFIKVSDSVLALRGREFLDYLYDEFGHQLALALENAIVDEIATSTLSVKVTHDMDGDAVLSGLAVLSDEAQNPLVITSKATYAQIKGIRTTTGARIEDAFEGLEVLFNNRVNGLLVGDLDGVIANFPDGEDFKYIVDEKSLAEEDMVKIVGKILASVHLVRPNGFAVVTSE